ncbi:MAG: hypothetical protein AB2L14_11170 [Candidatus Xenobiia bacterium LiM19]
MLERIQRTFVTKKKPLNQRGGSAFGCIAFMFVLILIGAAVYVFYLKPQGFFDAGVKINTVKNTTESQKREYLKRMKKACSTLKGSSRSLGKFISGVKSGEGEYKSQADINRKAMDIENRLEESLTAMKGLKTPEEFGEGQTKLMTSITDFFDCINRLRKLNSVIAGNMDQIDTAIVEIESTYARGNEKLESGMKTMRDVQKSLELPQIM